MKDGEGRIFLSFWPTLQSTDPPRWNPFYGSGTSRPLPGQHHPAASDCIVHTVDLLDTSLRITSPQDGSVQPTFVTVEGTCVGNRYVDLAVDGAENQRRPCFDGQTGLAAHWPSD